MKRCAALVLVLFSGFVFSGMSQGLDDEYVQIFRLIQEADGLSASSPSQALAKYLDAQSALDRLHKGSPGWNTRIVDYRLSYLADQIATLSTRAGTAPVGTNDAKTASIAGSGASPAPALPDWKARSAALEQQLAGLQSDNALMQAKLKEALAMRPAAADPAELARAQEKITGLEKQNELLRASRENQPQVTVDNAKLEQARRSATEANRQATEQADRVAKLTLEKQALEARLRQLSDAAATKTVAATPVEPGRLKELESQRDELQRRLDAANKELLGRKHKGGGTRNPDLETELVSARARIEVLEARATPYSSEELELLKRPEAKLTEAGAKPAKKSLKDLPPGAADQIAAAQKYFAAKEFEKAEAAYLQVLKLDPKNVAVLGNLAAIQAEAKRLDQAESNIQQALALDSDDPYSLYVLGIIRFRESKYDDAVGALSRSAKIDPQNAEVQNYLGLALSEKGLRVPAEAALRKAIQLQPNYAGAHYNLAVVYATQQPPSTELARFHYQKALAAGYPPNAQLEKRFESHQ
jgi:cytochrome c-type biogenesis protein CcmH/NrfG